ncbi:MAG: hypothetical protein ACFFE4_03885, partial [Candidatus Thorarchaeota archaeon]
HYEKALEDEFDRQQPYLIETLELESVQISDQKQLRAHIIEKKSLRKALAREFSNFLFELFTVYEYIGRRDYKSAIKVEHNLVRRFLVEVYTHYYNAKYLVTTKDLKEFINHLVSDAHIPFTKKELIGHVEKYQIVDFEYSDLAKLATEIYDFISEFFDKIQLYIYKEKEE